MLALWCDEIVSCRSGAMLLNWPGEQGQPHLWGHVQEAALFEAGSVLERRDLQEAAVRSADAVFAGPIRSGFELPEVCAYDVQSALLVMDCLAEGTGDPRYRELGQLARGWFEGRNPAGVPTYDRVSGRVLDGVRGDTVNPDSGAESNVCAGLALLDDPMVLELARTWEGDGANRS